MRSVGLDWAVKNSNRAAVCIEQSKDGLAVVSVTTQVSDEEAAIICTSPMNEVIAVDIPFAWPRAFTDFVGSWTPQNTCGTSVPDRLPFQYRATDRFVQEKTGKWPLSISTNMFSLGARIWAEFVHKADLGSQIVVTAEHGLSRKPAIIEVYPGATLRVFEKIPELQIFGRSSRVVERGDEPVEDEFSYKADPQTRRSLVRSLAQSFQLQFNEQTEDLLVGRGKADHATDALLAAINGLMFLGMVPGWAVVKPSEHQKEDARREGWIFFPELSASQHSPSLTNAPGPV